LRTTRSNATALAACGLAALVGVNSLGGEIVIVNPSASVRVAGELLVDLGLVLADNGWISCTAPAYPPTVQALANAPRSSIAHAATASLTLFTCVASFRPGMGSCCLSTMNALRPFRCPMLAR
jgi:hypothetical protein